jgi:hypothetical protein
MLSRKKQAREMHVFKVKKAKNAMATFTKLLRLALEKQIYKAIFLNINEKQCGFFI